MANIIDDAMRTVFLNSLQILQAEKLYNYQNYGRYPYRERKNSIQIVADFSVNAYSVNGLFVSEELYEIVYPQQIIETIDQVLVNTVEVFGNIYASAITYKFNGGQNTAGIASIEYAQELIDTYDVYETVVTREYVDVEATEIQALRYIFPFNCVDTEIGQILTLA